MANGRPRLFLDANILFASQLRDIFLNLAVARVIDAFWSEAVQREWTEALTRQRPDLATSVARVRSNMAEALPGSTVTGNEHLIARFSLPDSKDAHIAAAAAHAGCPIILTLNLRHFPAEALREHGLAAAHPDTFLAGLLAADAKPVIAAIADARAALVRPVIIAETYIGNLERLGLTKTAALLKSHIDAI